MIIIVVILVIVVVVVIIVVSFNSINGRWRAARGQGPERQAILYYIISYIIIIIIIIIYIYIYRLGGETDG